MARTSPFSEAFTPLYFVLIIAALVPRPSPYRRLCFVPILLLTYFVVFHTTSGDPSADYGLRLLWLVYFLFASDYILLTDVQRELHRVPSSVCLPDDSPNGGQVPSIQNTSPWRRLIWALDLFTSPRGVNWAHEPRSAIPTHPDPAMPRRTFIFRQLLKVVAIYLVYDLASLAVRASPAFAPGVDTGIATLHYLLGIICVAVHLTGPNEWPAFFGGVGDAWSVRSFWGRGWHQMLRRPLTTHARRLSRVLNLTPGSATARFLQLFGIFLLSGLLHAAAEAAVLRTPAAGAGALMFFALQPVAIVLEGVVIGVLQARFQRRPERAETPPIADTDAEGEATPELAAEQSQLEAERQQTEEEPTSPWVKRAGYALGYAWTLAWFALTLPLWQDSLIRGGLMDRGMPSEGSLLWAVWRRVWG
ncbi:membrane bound O-acyl transferase family-domain-containing protein [Mycena leptocephala]|nr:membrane bound O-acyl transferase family-domain-containing protein [Mycena leptocephala]